MNPDVFKHYTLGIPKLDDEHFHLIDLMESVMHYAFTGEYELCKETLNELDDHFHLHLNDEENYMIDISYPFYEAHKEYHDGLRREMKLCREKITSKKFKPDRYITEKLRDIFVRHIDEQDMQIATFINKNRM